MTTTDDLREVITGRGKHMGHTRTQRGQVMYCSCGASARIRLRPPPRLAVRLSDGFIAWRGSDPDRAAAIAARHEGAVVQDLGPLPPRRIS